MNTPYQIDADMIGAGFEGTAKDLHRFCELLAEITGRPVSDFVVRQHVSQYAGAEAPDEHEWNAAVEAFYEDRPDLFEGK